MWCYLSLEHKNDFMNQQESNRDIKDYISNERRWGSKEQIIYESLVALWHDREFVVNTMNHLAHPKDIKKATNYNRVLITFVIFWIIWAFLARWNYTIYNIILNIIFIYFFLKNNITAYYWYLFLAILNSVSLIILLFGNFASDTISNAYIIWWILIYVPIFLNILALLFGDFNNFIIAWIIWWILIFTPIFLSQKIITILLPNKEWNGIWITPNGIHVFPEK